jgi:ParB/RepB/Spo0J family partition protein
MTVTRIQVTDIRPDPKQPRSHFSEPALNALATSIKKVGQRTPISVRRRRAGANPPFEIVDGERRWRACKLAGIETIRISIEEADLEKHATQHRLSIVSNFMREGHTHMEISEAVSYQVNAAVEAGETHGQAVVSLAEDIGKSTVWVYSYLKLQNLCAALKERLHPDTPNNKRLRFVEAQILCDLSAANQQDIYRQLLKVKLPARPTLAKRLAEEITGPPRAGRPRDDKLKIDRFVSRLTADIERTMAFKQSAFHDAIIQMDRTERKDFRTSVAVLLDAIDRVTAPAPQGRAR